ncbi:hypothetical protein M5K25_019454 [Dendrobium thyrsiflorum]|uniref:Transmembrane protein n=1 Tax=Dendrobium thyrsiflorum TaxID=117978 RepID=A0ABD0ULT1_DENTH
MLGFRLTVYSAQVSALPMAASCDNNETITRTDACMTNSIASPITSPISNLGSLEHVVSETFSPLDGLVPKENVYASIGLDDQPFVTVGSPVDNNAEVPSLDTSSSLISNVVSTGGLGPIVNVPFVDVPIALISSDELKSQLASKFIFSHVDHSDWLDGSCSSPCMYAGEVLDEPEDVFHEYSLNVSCSAKKFIFHDVVLPNVLDGNKKRNNWCCWSMSFVVRVSSLIFVFCWLLYFSEVNFNFLVRSMMMRPSAHPLNDLGLMATLVVPFLLLIGGLCLMWDDVWYVLVSSNGCPCLASDWLYECSCHFLRPAVV